jgi:2-methylfumaryl-CoA hydratase
VSISDKTNRGRFFEDFQAGMTLRHAVPRTLTEGENALYIALTGDRTPLHCDAAFARALGFQRETVNDLLVFHTVFGKSVPDVSLNAVANLGYAGLRFLRPVYPGDTLRAESQVVGVRETSAGNAGVVWVRTSGFNQREEPVITFYRWVLVNKRDPHTSTGAGDAPLTPEQVPADELRPADELDLARFDAGVSGGRSFFEDYRAGERIHHADGMTIEESDHMLATRLYQNTARIHFDAHLMSKDPRFGRRLMYGGHVISVARALSFNGLENAVGMLAWNGGTHANPTFAGDTLYAWTDVLEIAPLSERLGALRLRLVAVKNLNPMDDEIPLRVRDEGSGREAYHGNVVLDLDYWLAMPRRGLRTED